MSTRPDPSSDAGRKVWSLAVAASRRSLRRGWTVVMLAMELERQSVSGRILRTAAAKLLSQVRQVRERQRHRVFFPERVKSVGPRDLVLEIGPGGPPHPRADVLLEKRFDDPAVAEAQRGHRPPLETTKEVVFHDGGEFPFADQQLDYVICFHALEYVAAPDAFVHEIARAGRLRVARLWV